LVGSAFVEDQAINPELQHFMARRINARTIEIKSSHVPFISHLDAVAKVIKEAADFAAKAARTLRERGRRRRMDLRIAGKRAVVCGASKGLSL